MARFPPPYNYPGTQARAFEILGDVCAALGQQEEAETAWMSAVTLYEGQPNETIGTRFYREWLADTYAKLAASHLTRKEAQQAASRREQARAVLTQLLQEYPGHPRLRQKLAQAP